MSTFLKIYDTAFLPYIYMDNHILSICWSFPCIIHFDSMITFYKKNFQIHNLLIRELPVVEHVVS